jgi:hypothetical protein
MHAYIQGLPKDFTQPVLPSFPRTRVVIFEDEKVDRAVVFEDEKVESMWGSLK